MKAYIKYNNENKLIPSTLLLRNEEPSGYGWVQIPETLCCSTVDFPMLSNTKMKGYVQYDSKGNVVQSSTRVSTVPPKSKGGTWKEVPYKRCCFFTPTAPTAGVVDDEADTFAFTLATGYTLAGHEMTLDGGETWEAATNPIAVGDVDAPINTVGVRVKATQTSTASAILWNTTPFTTA